jgi:hypothetical protein
MRREQLRHEACRSQHAPLNPHFSDRSYPQLKIELYGGSMRFRFPALAVIAKSSFVAIFPRHANGGIEPNPAAPALGS